jgi:hypothetical protein
MFNPGPAEYYDDGFRQVLEDHMAWLRTHQSTQVISVSAQDVWENEKDLFGYFQQINMAPQFHWVNMRLNNLTGPEQFVPPGPGALLVASITILEQLRSAYMTSSIISS